MSSCFSDTNDEIMHNTLDFQIRIDYQISVAFGDFSID